MERNLGIQRMLHGEMQSRETVQNHGVIAQRRICGAGGGCRVKQRCMQRNAGRKEVLHGGTFGAARDGAWGRTWCCSDSTGLQSCVTRICSIHPHPLTVLQHLLQQ